jgi:transposase-like protein
VTIEALKSQKTVAEITSEFEVHATQVNTWKKHLLDGAADTFSKKLENKEAEHEKEKEHLFSQIGHTRWRLIGYQKS